MTQIDPARTAAIIDAADAITIAYAAALRPLTEIAGHTTDAPPALDDAMNAVGWLITSGPQLDHAMTRLLMRLCSVVSRDRVRRLIGVRLETLTNRILDSDTPPAPVVLHARVGMFTDRDKVSVRAGRESLITAAADLIRTYADALRPLSQLSQGGVPDSATVDAALEGVAILHHARRDLDMALDRVLACLVLGGVKRMSLAEVVGVAPSTLQKRLSTQPFARARHADLVRDEDGTWTVERAAVGRWAS